MVEELLHPVFELIQPYFNQDKREDLSRSRIRALLKESEPHMVGVELVLDCPMTSSLIHFSRPSTLKLSRIKRLPLRLLYRSV